MEEKEKPRTTNVQKDKGVDEGADEGTDDNFLPLNLDRKFHPWSIPARPQRYPLMRVLRLMIYIREG